MQNARIVVVGDTEVPPKYLVGVCHQILAPQWHIRGEAQSRLECGLGVLHVSPHGLRDMCMIKLGLLALNEYESGVIDILIKSVCNIGWCIVGRQAIWWEVMLVLIPHKIRAACTSQGSASLTYHIRDWTTCLIDSRRVSLVHLCGGTCGNDYSRVDLHHSFHTHHGFHHCVHLLFHGLHVGLHLLLHLLYFAHFSSSSTRSVRVL